MEGPPPLSEEALLAIEDVRFGLAHIAISAATVRFLQFSLD